MLSKEVENTKFDSLKFDLPRGLNPRSTRLKVNMLTITCLGLEPTIYPTQGEHANHYTINVIIIQNKL
jgi:hypothetical protein